MCTSEYFPKLSTLGATAIVDGPSGYLAMSAAPECTVTFPIENKRQARLYRVTFTRNRCDSPQFATRARSLLRCGS